MTSCSFARGATWYSCRVRAASALCLALVAAPLAAHADPPVTPDAPAVDPRLDLLERDALHAKIWFWGFTSAYALAAVAQTTFALVVDESLTSDADGLRVDSAVGAASAWLALGGMIISPIPRVWRAATSARNGGSLDAAITAAADAENQGRAWYNHVLVGVVSVAAGLTLWLGYDRPISAAITFAENALIGELNLLLIPTRSANHRRSAVAWSFAPSVNGASLVGVW